MAAETVLIIEPMRRDASALAEGVLEPEGYTVHHALNEVDGLRLALDERPDLIIADLAAARKSEPDLIARLRQAGHETPVILTSYSNEGAVYRWAFEMHAADFLRKPVDLENARTAVRRAIGSSSARERVEMLRTVHELARAATSADELEVLLNRIVEAAVQMSGAEEGFLLLLDDDGEELYVRAAQGLGQEFAAGFRVKSRDSMVWKVVQTGTPAILTSPVESTGPEKAPGVRSMLHVPLRADGSVIGVLSVHSKSAERSFTQEDQALLGVLTDYAAASIDRVLQLGRAEEVVDQQGQQPEDREVPAMEPEKAVPVDRLFDELQAQRTAAEEGRREVERLTQAVASQLSVLQQVTDAWHRQQTEAEGLARRLATPDDAAGADEAAPAPITLADLGEPLDHVGTGLVIADSQGIVRLANGAAEGILRGEKLVGQSLRQLSPSPRWVDRIDQLSGLEAIGTDFWDDITFWHQGRLIKALFLPGSGGEQGRTVILRDLVRDRGVRLSLDDVKAAVFMELRTPLTILSNHTELLLGGSEGELSPAQKRLLDQMRENLNLINKHLEKPVALPGLAEDQRLAYPAADLTTAVHDALSWAAQWSSNRQITVEPELPDQLPRVAAQADCVYEMVVDLLKNAIQATPDGGTVRVFAASGVEHDGETRRPHVLLSVSDQGGGIPAERLGQVFQRLPSKEGRPVPGLGGTGQELVQVRTLVEAFGGRVWAETEPGVGTILSFVLPAVWG